jgi:IS4 transposase
MEYITEDEVCQDLAECSAAHSLVGEEWSTLLQILRSRVDLDMTAKQTKALLRKREIKQAADLLRLVLAYAVCDWSLRLVGVWCAVIGLGHLSDTAILKRLQHCQKWLGHLVGVLLDVRLAQLSQQPGIHLRLMDATVVSRPGSTGTDWVIHLSLDLTHLCVDGVEVTDAHSGETLARHPLQPHEIRVGDRGHAFARSMGPVLAEDGWLVVRTNWQNLPLQYPDGSKVDVIEVIRTTNALQSVVEQQVWLPTPQGCFPLRLIVAALPQEAADAARRRVRKAYRKKGKTPDARTLLAAGFTLIVTNLPAEQWTAEQVLRLYRLRWQVELHFKRLKSLLHLDHLRAQNPQLAQVYLLGKLLAALLLDHLTHQVRRACPDWFQSLERPVSVWRVTALLFDAFRAIVRGQITLLQIFQALPYLGRFLCDAPRRRVQQLAHARLLLDRLSFC